MRCGLVEYGIYHTLTRRSHFTHSICNSMLSALTHWPLGDFNEILCNFQTDFSDFRVWHFLWNCSSQLWFRSWLGAVGQQAITWANVDPDICRHMVSLGHNELSWQSRRQHHSSHGTTNIAFNRGRFQYMKPFQNHIKLKCGFIGP